MARPVYSKQLFAEEIVVGGVAVYEVPDAVTVVVRDIAVLITPGTGSNATVTLTAAGIPFWTEGAPPQIPRYRHIEGRWVAPGPSELEATLISTDTSATAYIYVSGYYLPS